MNTLDNALVKKAQRHLAKADPIFKMLIKQYPPFLHKEDFIKSPFEALVRAVASQQLHSAAAEAILRRFIALVPAKLFPCPEDMMPLSDEQLRACGFSYSKIATIRSLSEHVVNGAIPSEVEIRTLSDEDIITRITQVRGIGKWTVEMLLIFHLGRLDVWPVDDFGIRNGYMLAHGLAEMPKPKELRIAGEKWKPFRTVASWYFWCVANG